MSFWSDVDPDPPENRETRVPLADGDCLLCGAEVEKDGHALGCPYEERVYVGWFENCAD